jgi:hypothetical protein
MLEAAAEQPATDAWRQKLAEIDADNLSPREALDLLYRLIDAARE